MGGSVTGGNVPARRERVKSVAPRGTGRIFEPMHEEPPPPPQAPLPVRIARTASALVMFPWPFIAIVAFTSLRHEPAGALDAMLASPWGTLRALIVVYPLVTVPAFLVSRALLARRRVFLAAAAAAVPLLCLLAVAYAADALTRLRTG